MTKDKQAVPLPYEARPPREMADYIINQLVGGGSAGNSKSVNYVEHLYQAAIASSAAAPEQADRAQSMRDAGYTRRPTLREIAEPVNGEGDPWRIPSHAELLENFRAATQAQPAPAAEVLPGVTTYQEHGMYCVTYRSPVLQMSQRALAALTEVARPSAPLSEPTAEGVTDDQWIELAERHAVRDWNSDKPDGYLNAVKALCTDFAALSSPASSAGRPSDDALWDQTLAERDRYHERADELAGAIAAHLGIDIGEHSNLNDPWQNALDAIASKEKP